MGESTPVFMQDNGGRRSGGERRQFSYLVHIPECRSGKDRRSGIDRRIGIGTILDSKRERRFAFKAQNPGRMATE